ncbi:MAG: threonine synthase [Alphaproteobacteria bacterium]
MRYISTRGQAAPVGFAGLLLTGPAPDGGLYMPEAYPSFSGDALAKLGNADYREMASRIVGAFAADDFTPDEIRADTKAAYDSFTSKSVAPLREIGRDRFLLELFHGPTLAFKDIALQLLGRLVARELNRRHARATVIVATSGDTGSAAIAAFGGRPGVDVFVLHPRGRISEVQRRQMTTATDKNVHNAAVEGSFDDAQKLVKALFAESEFASGARLCAVNSINFMRIAAQCVYYFTASASLGIPATFVVPTGNFGNVFAGEVAARMGLPVERLVAATNANDVVGRALGTGAYSPGTARATLSPAMDIHVPGNFERALFEASGRDAAWLAEAMQKFSVARKVQIPPIVLDRLRGRYAAASVDDCETSTAMARVYRQAGALVDPHTAVGLAVADRLAPVSHPVVVLATAHPAKFPDAVERATGVRPPAPPQLEGLLEAEERYDIVPSDLEALKTYISGRIRSP